MGIYSRAGTSLLWCSYTAHKKRVFESTGTADRRAAAAFLARRRRELREGTWTAPGEPKPDPQRPTVAVYVDAWVTRRRRDGVKTINDEAARLKAYVVPHIGARPMADVKRTEIRDLMSKLQREPSTTTKKPLAPRTVLHVYGVVRLLFVDAVAEEVVAASPCTLRVRKGELPRKRDADPSWRSGAVYTREEATSLISDEKIPLDRRIFYALALFTGMRSGEVIGRRWRDWDPTTRPLGKLLVATQYDGAELKTEVPREVPVHAELAKILDAWKGEGFAMYFKRPPRPDDWIIPSRHDVRSHRSKKTLERMKDDLERLELRTKGRGRHAMRSTFISLARADGAPRDVLQFVTHDGKGDQFDAYTKWPWHTLCEAVQRLRLAPSVAWLL